MNSNRSKECICQSKTFEEVYHCYAPELRRFMFFKSQDTDLTEDLVQEAFVRLWNHCNEVDYNKVKSYLFTTAHNLFLNGIKHEKVKRKYKATVKEDRHWESPEFVLLEKEFMDRLQRCIAQLPEKNREVFLLSRMEKKKYREIAVCLNVSVKTVEKRMQQALFVLREQLELVSAI